MQDGIKNINADYLSEVLEVSEWHNLEDPEQIKTLFYNLNKFPIRKRYHSKDTQGLWLKCRS